MKTPLHFLLIVAGLALAGCSTVHNRIEEKSAVFNSLAPEQQARIKQGLVDLGYTEDMVYMAMGKPDDILEKTTAAGRETTWVYKTYYRQYEGTHFAGYRRSLYYDDHAKAWRVYYEPVQENVYSEQVEEVARIVFKDRIVAVIEQAKR